ncbi:DNA mismatch repair protein MutS [Olivibacter ginsenosidimutans]|uniref:DNA mismatch repair protein MutS n=1 Tax=Olivibacter ginsenosidimutans TaxID=1176537 RepID=A0ABP9AVC2_9SPHI
MEWNSILFKNKGLVTLPGLQPAFFVDLHLDQVVQTIVEGKEQYALIPYFYQPLIDRGTILYRQEIFAELEDRQLIAYIRQFAIGMEAVRQAIPMDGKYYYDYQKEWMVLDAVLIYGETIHLLSEQLLKHKLESTGLVSFRDSLIAYCHSEKFIYLYEEASQLQKELVAIRYILRIKGLTVQVLPDEEKEDYTAGIKEVVRRFSGDNVGDYHYHFPKTVDTNHVEAHILDGVASLYPEIFGRLKNFCQKNTDFLEQGVVVFDREIQFYMAYHEYKEMLKAHGLRCCIPDVTDLERDIYVYNSFDIALAANFVKEQRPIVCNDFLLKSNERIFVVTGPNQGGKTTFARTFGQLHYLACLGCPVPGRKARLFVFDRLFTHFEREENLKDQRSKLEDDLIRIHRMISEASAASIIILNEIFSSTALQDAVFLSKKIMEKIVELDAYGVWVTFIEEVVNFGPTCSVDGAMRNVCCRPRSGSKYLSRGIYTF